ncbi:hypothetical protein EFR01_55080 [Sinorhizobium fredii]|nr:hypothetical protein EFR01_55080 [Sinorhizobium fredii]GLS09363.1 hypothetical protein GCM10007864_29930 [Sinorhizobium fredii]
MARSKDPPDREFAPAETAEFNGMLAAKLVEWDMAAIDLSPCGGDARQGRGGCHL